MFKKKKQDPFQPLLFDQNFVKSLVWINTTLQGWNVHIKFRGKLKALPSIEKIFGTYRVTIHVNEKEIAARVRDTKITSPAKESFVLFVCHYSREKKLFIHAQFEMPHEGNILIKSIEESNNGPLIMENMVELDHCLSEQEKKPIYDEVGFNNPLYLREEGTKIAKFQLKLKEMNIDSEIKTLFSKLFSTIEQFYLKTEEERNVVDNVTMDLLVSKDLGYVFYLIENQEQITDETSEKIKNILEAMNQKALSATRKESPERIFEKNLAILEKKYAIN